MARCGPLPSGGEVPLRRIEVSLLYSDVRNFTAFAETASPEEVAAFLDRLMRTQIECVSRHDGDVDKLIGDALLARFEGPEKERRAVSAAADIQTAVRAANLPRGVGIGIFTGQAILGPIGPPARRDFTVIGDLVNIVARLCAEARRGEIVADAATLGRGAISEMFGSVEKVQVKGKGTADLHPPHQLECPY